MHIKIVTKFCCNLTFFLKFLSYKLIFFIVLYNNLKLIKFTLHYFMIFQQILLNFVAILIQIHRCIFKILQKFSVIWFSEVYEEKLPFQLLNALENFKFYMAMDGFWIKVRVRCFFSTKRLCNDANTNKTRSKWNFNFIYQTIARNYRRRFTRHRLTSLELQLNTKVINTSDRKRKTMQFEL